MMQEKLIVNDPTQKVKVSRVTRNNKFRHQPSPQKGQLEEKPQMGKIYSYSRTLRHFAEIRQKIGENALNKQVCNIFQKKQKGDPGNYNTPETQYKPQQDNESLKSLRIVPKMKQNYSSRPITQVQERGFACVQVNESTQTDEMHARIATIMKPIESKSSYVRTIKVRQFLTEKYYKKQSLNDYNNQEVRVVDIGHKLELDNISLPDHCYLQRLKTNNLRKFMNSSKSRVSSAKCSQPQFDFTTEQKGQFPFKFTQIHKKKAASKRNSPYMFDEDI